MYSRAEQEAAGSNDSLGMPAEFMAMVQKLEGQFTENAHTSMPDPSIEAEDAPISARVRSTEDSDVAPASEEDDGCTLKTLSECVAAQSSRPPIARVVGSELSGGDGAAILQNHTEAIEPRPAPAPGVIEGISLNASMVATRGQKMIVEDPAALGRPVFKKAEDSKQTFPNRNQMLVASAQSLLDSCAQPEVEGIRAGLDAFMQSLATICAERVSADLRNSNKVCIEEVEKKVAQLMQASLDSLAANLLDQCRKEFDRLVNEFLSKSSPQAYPAPGALLNDRHDYAVTHLPKDAKSSPRAQLDRPGAQTRSAKDLMLWVSLSVIILVVIPAMLAIYSLNSPVARLRQQPPASFYRDDPHWSARQSLREERLARGYWEIAVREIQGEYGFGTALPANPPDDFKVEENGSSPNTPSVDSADRSKYWEKLREAWPRSESWERTKRIALWMRTWMRPGE